MRETSISLRACLLVGLILGQRAGAFMSPAVRRGHTLKSGGSMSRSKLIEKSGGSRKAIEGSSSDQPKFDLLTTKGIWRLIFTTGDVKTQKQIGGKLTYVPIKAVQVFNPDYTITNGVYLGSFPLLKFSGSFTWAEEVARLEFVFDQVGVLGLNFPYNQGETKVKPGFTFMDISERYVIARGAGGGLALWLRQDSI